MKLFLSVCLCAKTFYFLRSTPFHTECERHRRRLQELRGFPPVQPPRRCGGHEQHLPQGLKHEGSRELWVKQIEFPSGREMQATFHFRHVSINLRLGSCFSYQFHKARMLNPAMADRMVFSMKEASTMASGWTVGIFFHTQGRFMPVLGVSHRYAGQKLVISK